MNKNKTTTAIILILMFAIAISLVALPAANAQQATRNKTTHAFIGAQPNPVQVGKTVLLHVGITDYLVDVRAGWVGLSVEITKPDGTTQTITGIKTDSTGGTGVSFKPTVAGNYTLQTHFPEQTYTWTSAPIFDPEFNGSITYKASDSEELTLVVVDEPLPEYPSNPLPTSYWTRPVDAQFRDWNTIAGNWPYAPLNLYAPYNDAPETPHVLWAKSLIGTAGSPLGGGLTGGEFGDHSYENGDAYEGFFLAASALGYRSPVIMGGVLYFNRFKADGGTAVQQDVVAVDLRTGKELWAKNWNNTRVEFGQLMYWDSWNYHAVFSYLWQVTGSTYKAFEAGTGRFAFAINNVPSGTRVNGQNGEIIIYTINLANGWITKWNSTRVVVEQRRTGPLGSGNQALGSWVREYMGQTLNGTYGYEWNKTIPRGLPGAVANQGQIWQVIDGDIILGNDAIGWAAIGDAPIKLWAISLKPGQEGTLLYNTTWQKPLGDIAMRTGAVSPENRVFTLFDKENRQQYGFNMDTGAYLWGPTDSMDYRGIYGMTQVIAYGKLFVTADFGGEVAAYDIKNGTKLWSYVAKDPYVTDTFVKEVGGTEWALSILFVSDGKIYIGQSEHSPYNPLPRGAPLFALDVNTGAEVFRVDGMLRQTRWGARAVIGDSIIASMDTYDQLLYAVGKGPTSTTVSASSGVATGGSSVLLTGTVIDISPGTADLTLRFPKGVPAVADEFMGEWMKYVYKQFERPKNAVGVAVSIDAIDPNGNDIHIGDTTSDSNGFYSFKWLPPADITGKYTITATFGGSKSYWSSSAETALVLDEAPAAQPEQNTSEPSMADIYFVPAIIGLLVAIIVVGALLALLVLKKRP